ncbi:MAG: PD-(D/E)XK nuclease family protein, partial [bacterium]
YLNAPADTYHLWGVLKSPLVGISDESAFFLQEAGWFDSSSGKQEIPVTVGSEDRLKLTRFLKMSRPLIKNIDRLTTAEIIEEVISASGYGAFLMGSGEQRLANLQILMEISREFESLLEHDFRSFSDYLGYLIRTSPNREEAKLLKETDNVVRLMTIHQAKGLEFPVVVAADLERTFPSNHTVYLDERIGLGLKAFPSLTGSGQDTPITGKIREAIRNKEKEEKKRLLYVALTRAERLLIFISQPKPEKNSWMASIRDFAEEFPELIIRESERSISAPSPKINKPEAEKRNENISEIISQSCGYRPQPVFNATVSATGLSNYFQCQRRYYWDHVLGFCGDIRPADTNPQPAMAGEVAHQILERIDFNPDHPENETVISDLTEGLEEKEQISLAVTGFLRSDLGKMARSADRVYREHPFSLSLKSDPHSFFIKGKIDLLFQTGDQWIIVDYKYSGTKPVLPLNYRIQLQIYTYTLQYLYPDQTVKSFLQFLKPPRAESVELSDISSFKTTLTRTMLDLCQKRKEKREHWKKNPLPHCSAIRCPYLSDCH